MTQLRNNPASISNYFDEIERGVGKRGSTFTDIDGVSHDLDTHRFLFREFKQPGEPLNKAQRWTLADLATLPRCTVWFLRRLGNDVIGFGHFQSGRREEQITVTEYRRRLRCWWNDEPYWPPPSACPTCAAPMLAPEETFCTSAELTADDIPW